MWSEVGGIAENKRLDSWKEIAAFFGRDERTVKRWEKNRSLPVHRVPGSQRGGVFAYTHELTRWLNSAPAEKESAENPEHSPQPLTLLDSDPTIAETLAEPIPLPLPRSRPPRPIDTQWKGMAAAVLIIFITIAVFAIRHARSNPGDFRSVSSGAAAIAPMPAGNPVHAKAAPNRQAVEFYLKGRYYWNRRTGDSLNRAVDSFTQAIVLDPSYAEAYAGLADTYDLMREYASMPESEAYPRAIAAATKAVSLDDSLAEAHRALAFGLFYWKWEIPEAIQEYQRAIQLNPKDADAHHWYATSLLSIGRSGEALAEIERARALSPASPSILADRALIIYNTGNRAEGIATLKEMEQTEPGFLSPPRYLAAVYFERGDYPDFIEQTKRASLLSRDTDEIAVADAAKRGWQSGGEHGLLEALLPVQQRMFDKGQSCGPRLAYIYLLLGRKKDAVHYLQAAFQAHDSGLFSLPHSRFATELKGDPEFEQLKLRVQSYVEGSPDRIPLT